MAQILSWNPGGYSLQWLIRGGYVRKGERGTFFRIKVYERVGKSVTSVCKNTQKDKQMHFMAVKRSWKRSDFVIYSYLKLTVRIQQPPWIKLCLVPPLRVHRHQKPTVDVYKSKSRSLNQLNTMVCLFLNRAEGILLYGDNKDTQRSLQGATERPAVDGIYKVAQTNQWTGMILFNK